jgi:hypothetical protein
MKHISSLITLLIAASNLAAQNKSLNTSPPGIIFHNNANTQFDQHFINPQINSGALQLVNGSFEINSGTCIVNGNNNIISTNVAGTTAYGCAGEIDLMYNSCGYGTALSGNIF